MPCNSLHPAHQHRNPCAVVRVQTKSSAGLRLAATCKPLRARPGYALGRLGRSAPSSTAMQACTRRPDPAPAPNARAPAAQKPAPHGCACWPHSAPARAPRRMHASAPAGRPCMLLVGRENHRGSSFRSPSGSASLTQLIQADTSGWTPGTTDPMPPVRGPGGATGEEQLVLTPDSNREGPPMIIPGNGPRGGEGGGEVTGSSCPQDLRIV